MSFHFSRRSFLQYAPLATAAVAVPVVSLAMEPEMKEPDIRDFLANASATDRARYHANKLADCMNEITPGVYTVKLDHKDRVALIVDQS